jgi:hypothetical protein
MIVYLDDILVFSNSWGEHCGHLHQIFEVLQRERLVVKRRKCQCFVKQLTFLGHKLDANGSAFFHLLWVGGICIHPRMAFASENGQGQPQ